MKCSRLDNKMGYTNPCNDPQRPPTGPNYSQRAPTSPNDLQRSKLLLQLPPTTQIIIITSSNDPQINTIHQYAYPMHF